ncbi:MAG: hypothetical protein F6K47_32405 [Symploca sp. SIO2E6]|nr:hypothetical protein [Symploca sp. SIO2E6]
MGNHSNAIAQRYSNTAAASSIGDSPCLVNLAAKPPSFKPSTGTLQNANQSFHTDYNRLIVEESTKFGHPQGSTVLIVSGAKVTFCHNGKKVDKPISELDIYHILKAIGHQTLGLYLTLSSLAEQGIYDLQASFTVGQSAQTIEEYLKDQKQLLEAALREVKAPDQYQVLDKQELSEIKASQEFFIQKSINYITQVLNSQTIDISQLNEYIHEVAPYIVQGVNQATTAQLEGLNKVIKELKPEEWKSPYVVIQTVHQARYRETVIQYFERMFNEPQGNAAERENRIVVIEDNFDDNRALRLLASHIIDQKIGLAFFQDPKRMQRDALSDAATFWLWEHELEIPEWPSTAVRN